MAEERYKNGSQNLCDFIGLVPSKKRKRRTSFTPQALEILNQYFERSTHPTGQLLYFLVMWLSVLLLVLRIMMMMMMRMMKSKMADEPQIFNL